MAIPLSNPHAMESALGRFSHQFVVDQHTCPDGWYIVEYIYHFVFIIYFLYQKVIVLLPIKAFLILQEFFALYEP
jgi:hypothetical protein